ncbi:hypothetical protein [uncultured Sphingomonas sp.]
MVLVDVVGYADWVWVEAGGGFRRIAGTSPAFADADGADVVVDGHVDGLR